MSEKSKTQKFLDYHQNLNEALKNGKVTCIIKIGEDFFPQSISTTMAPCVCQFTEDEIIFNSCNTGSLFWKKTIKFVKGVPYSDISNIIISVNRKLNAVLGVFPTYFYYLELNILLKNNERFILECNAFEEIPELIKILTINNIEFIDKFNLSDILNSIPEHEFNEYLHNNFDNMINKVN